MLTTTTIDRLAGFTPRELDAIHQENEAPAAARASYIAGVARAAGRIVADSPAYAWRNCVQSPLHELPGGFVVEYRELLDGAAIAAMALTLPEAWTRTGLGYRMRAVSEDEMGSPYGPHDGVAEDWYWAAWDRAAEAIDGHALAAAAGLEGELAAYRD